MRLRFLAIAFAVFVSVLAIYNICQQEGGAIDTVVGMARRITYGALFAVGFTAASLVLRKWMSHPSRPLVPAGSNSAAPPPPVPTFAMNVHTGPGQYRVRGVDHDTRFETVEIIYADSPENAKMKVELKGVDVAEVEPLGP
jgi:hypothetical protein